MKKQRAPACDHWKYNGSAITPCPTSWKVYDSHAINVQAPAAYAAAAGIPGHLFRGGDLLDFVTTRIKPRRRTVDFD